jgi:hypothetical protein
MPRKQPPPAPKFIPTRHFTDDAHEADDELAAPELDAALPEL